MAKRLEPGMKWMDAKGWEWEVFEIMPFGRVRVRTTDRTKVADLQTKLVKDAIFGDKVISDIFELLPKTQRTLFKNYQKYPFQLANDVGYLSLHRVILGGKEIGAVKYYRGRKLCIWTKVEPAVRAELAYA